MLNRTILQIIAVHGYEAVYENPATKKEEAEPVFVFALIEEPGDPEDDESETLRYVIPLTPSGTGTLEPCDEASNYKDVRLIKA